MSAALIAPSSGRKTMAWYMPLSALHQVDVFDRDRAAIAVVGDQNGEADGGFGGGHRQHQEREHLAHQVAEEGGERDEIDVDREQDQLDRHQNDDDVLPIQDDAGDADREQDCRDDEILGEADGHIHPCNPAREATLRSVTSAGVRAFWSATTWRLTSGLCCRVSTIAPIIAVSRTSPAAWKR